MGVAFHDWYDFRPFYRDKFLRVARRRRKAEGEIDAVSQLFSVSFPEFSFWTPNSVVRALKDKRVEELRKLVAAAVKGEVLFDRDFAARTLAEVFKIERSIGRFRSYVGYATTPLNLIPVVGTGVEKAVVEATVAPIARKRRKPYRWFYLISELASAG